LSDFLSRRKNQAVLKIGNNAVAYDIVFTAVTMVYKTEIRIWEFLILVILAHCIEWHPPLYMSVLLFQGNSKDYEKAVKAAREAWQVWADVRTPHHFKGLHSMKY